MASGNLSPRQKMINMMYLVLTALLALNVSAEILESFQMLADSLKRSAEEYNDKNRALAGDIKATVESQIEQGDRSNEPILKLVDSVRTHTNNTVDSIQSHIDKLHSEQIAGQKEDLEYHLRKPDERENNYRYWMKGSGGNETANQGQGAGEAIHLQNTVNGYVAWANKFRGSIDSATGKPTYYEEIAREPKVMYPDSLGPEYADVRSKTWEYYTFHGQPAVANLAVLERLKNEIRVIESDLLQFLRRQLSDIEFKIDELVGMGIPESQTVVAGIPFKTKLFPTIRSQSFEPKFSVNQGKLEISENGFEATQTITPNREGELSYGATIRVPRAGGKSDTTLNVKNTVSVVKPAIQVQSAAVTNLYRNCMNQLEVNCPLLQQAGRYNPSFKLRGGRAVSSKKSKNKVAVVPTGQKALLEVFNQLGSSTGKIGEVKYTVIKPPKPTLRFLVNGKNMRSVVPKGKLTVGATADEDFAKLLPKDARYRLVNVELNRKQGLTGWQKVKTKAKSNVSARPNVSFDLNRHFRGMGPGDSFFVEIGKVQRINFQNQPIDIPFQRTELVQQAKLGRQ